MQLDVILSKKRLPELEPKHLLKFETNTTLLELNRTKVAAFIIKMRDELIVEGNDDNNPSCTKF